MTRSRALVWLRVAFLVVTTPLLFAFLEERARTAELRMDVAALHLVDVHRVPTVLGTTALILPLHSTAFWVQLTPSCSSLASVLTLACLAAVLPRRLATGRRRLLAFLAAGLAIVVGNLLRIDLSIFAGVLFSRASLVLFHDWAGSIFGFAYTMGGFVLMLWVLLPSGHPRTRLPGLQPPPPEDLGALPAGGMPAAASR